MTIKIKKPKLRLVKRPAQSIQEASQPDHKVRYRMKPEHAAAVKTRALRNYRKAQEDFELAGNTVLRSLEYLEDYAETIVVRNELTGRTSQMRIVRLTVLAKLLNTSYQTVWRWTSATGQLPEPVLVANLDRERPVYHVEEVRCMVRAIGDHLNEFKYYRKDHTGTRDRIFHDIDQLRQSNYGEGQHHGSQTQSRRQGPGSKARVKGIRRPG